MGTTADKLNYLKETQEAIKTALIDKGVEVSDGDTFRSYAEKISNISSEGGSSGGYSDDWKPNELWWDIETILKEDTKDFPGKVAYLLYNNLSSVRIMLNENSPGVPFAVLTSDGSYYDYTTNGNSVIHTWDTSKDKDTDLEGLKTRYIIAYFLEETLSLAHMSTNAYYTNSNACYLDPVYFVVKANLNVCDLLSDYYQTVFYLRSFKLLDGYHIEPPAGENNYFKGRSTILKIPDNFNTSEWTNFGDFAYSATGLHSLPEGLDLRNGTKFTNFCYNTYIINAKLLIGGNDKTVNLSNLAFLNKESLVYIAENAEGVTNSTVSFHAGLMSTTPGVEEDVIRVLTDKGWVVN